ncbi:MAG: phosphoribosylglycinamide formyltransferase [Myxococcales bacterium]|nr:phosphoribosylglycinamide formyltransferase [Myxococcales bacterium]
MRFAVLVSGSGSNLLALLEAERSGALAPAQIAVVVSNRPGVLALERAATFGKPAHVVDHRAYSDRLGFERALLDLLQLHQVEAVVLAGFMRVLTAQFTDRFPLRIVNTHPSLLPAFPGAHATADAVAHGVKVSGVTVHFVDATLDGGPIIAQRTVPVEDGDDATSLHRRIQRVEHQLLPEVVAQLARGQLLCEGRVVRQVHHDAQ